ncbi:MAG: AAA family ATPase [Candidatus Saccharimonadales bacterium]
MQVNLQSVRARQARSGKLFGQKWFKPTIVAVVGVLVLFGLLLILQAQSVGWLVVTLAAWPLMPLVWHEWWLKDLPPAKTANSIDDLLDGQLLEQLPHDVSPKQLAELTMRTNGGLFFAIRFGIGPNFLGTLSSSNAADTEKIWNVALDLRSKLQLPTISTAVVTAALVEVMPGRDQLLAQLQLKLDDIHAGVRWYHHLQDLIAAEKQRKLGGGIGRDLSFGYTPLLSRFAVNVSDQVAGGGGALTRKLEGHQALLGQLMQQLGKGGRQNAVLVGPSGVGKTTLVYAFAEKLLHDEAGVPSELRYRQVMALDPASLISNARGRGELEGLLNQILIEAYHAKNVILFFDNAELFFSDETGAVDLRNVLLPVLEGGGLRMILAMDEQQWLRLSRATPSLAQKLNRITVASLGEADTLLVSEDQLLMHEFHRKVTYMYQTLKAAYRLGQRYVPDQAMPGQALTLLEAAAQNAQGGLVTAASVEQAVEQTFGVKVATARQGDERQTLLNLEQLLHERMVNQTRAVTVVANALRRARSGVRNQNRPIGSFLFLGPTGVGKTELAKALAAVYFGGEDRLVRLDLNEFGSASDVKRLIADGATDPRSLTAQIAKQPFSVVLLDEIEKAHGNVLNTLLQLLDEGILRDINNREVSFRDAIIIATSNAGADAIRKAIEAGQSLEQFEPQFIDQLINSQQFKPEFLNRFDEIVTFRPLTAEELLQVVDLMLGSVNKTLAQQQISVQVADDAKLKLVEVGNDPRLGARPLRRVVQRTVENIVAKRLLAGQVAPGDVIQVTLSDVDEALKQ